MPHVAHFAINADDIARGRRFYETVCGWKFTIPGQKMTGYECSISVPDVDAVAAAVGAAGGKVIMPKVVIAGVGSLIFFQDTEGNVAGAMQYSKDAK
jgi:predicted enzyme related to lactoylglutathione lyase